MATLPRPENDDLYEDLAYQNYGYDASKQKQGRIGKGDFSNRTNTRFLGTDNVRRKAFGLDEALVDDLAQRLGMNPLDILPDYNSRQEYMQNVEYFRTFSDADYDRFRAQGFYGDFDPELGGTYVDPEDDDIDTSPARMDVRGISYTNGQPVPPEWNKEIPTATSMPQRPRTVAALWDARRNVLTLVFRDGTFYNYYDVDVSTWRQFKGLPSKWMFIRDVLNGHPRGQADVAGMPADQREFLYRASRAAQVRKFAATYKSPQKRAYYNYRKSPKGQARWQKQLAKKRGQSI